MVNVPQAVWVDEAGKVVRPTEVSGAALSLNLAKMRRLRSLYLDAIPDWVANGETSPYAFDEAAARAHLPEFTEDIALAHTNFHLGQTLWSQGDREEGAVFLEAAVELNPNSWNFYRQMKNLEHVLGSGGPAFFRRTRKHRKQGLEYYPRPDMPGMNEA
jgi:tetratricopeptide (TPR) repeat protein